MTEHLIRTLIVDDEQNSREVLAHLLGAYSEITVVAEAKSAEEAYQKIISTKPDLVFLDIQMPKGDGFTLLKKFEQIYFEIIFVTSFNQYAINAVKVSALDYLLKPIDTEELDFAVEKASKHIADRRNIQDKIDSLIQHLQSPQVIQKINIHFNGQVKFLAVQDILIIEASGRYSTITLVNGDTYTSAKNLKDFEEELTLCNHFLRVSKSQLINVSCITAYSKTKSCFITLTNGTTVEVSRRKKSQIISLLSAKRIS